MLKKLIELLLKTLSIRMMAYIMMLGFVAVDFIWSYWMDYSWIISGLEKDIWGAHTGSAVLNSLLSDADYRIKTGLVLRSAGSLLIGLCGVWTGLYIYKRIKKRLFEIAAGESINTQAPIREEEELRNIFAPIYKKINNYQKEISNCRKKLELEAMEKNRLLTCDFESIHKDKIELERQRAAILNMLEDINVSQDELKSANIILEKKQKELEALKSLSDELNGAEDLDSAVRIINNHIAGIIGFTAAVYLVSNMADEGSLVYSAYLQKPVNENYFFEVKEEIKAYYKNNKQEDEPEVCKFLDLVKPRIFGSRLDNSLAYSVKSKMLVPLRAGGRIIGVIHLSSDDNDFGNNKNQNELSSAILTPFSLSIARLQSLAASQYSMTKSLLESLSDGVIMLNKDKKNVMMNPAALKLTGLTFEGFSLDEMDRLFAGISLNEKINDALLKGSIFHLNKIKIVYFYYEIFITPVKDNSGSIVGCAIILRDITYLEEIDRMKTEFVSVASHQLRTPLTAIKLFTDMLLKGEVGKLNGEQIEYLNHIFQSTDNMVGLVYDLLNVTRIESGRLMISPQPTAVDRLISGIISEISPIAENKGIKIEFKIQDQLPEVPIDQNLFRQVVHNLLTNAVRYSRDGTGIQIKMIRNGDNFVISVKDQGIGIPEEVKNRIFHKFFRADNAVKAETEGTGLGLYVSKMIMEASGGKLRFESEVSKGTTFFIEMPLAGMPEKKGDRGLMIS